MYKKLNLPHIHIILVTSGLGNQMFCYAYYQALKKTYSNSIFLLDSDSHIYGHYGLEIFNVLHCRGEWRWYLYRLIKKIYPRFFSKFTTIKQINALAYEPLDPTLMENNTYHIGFHQSEKYFLQHSNTIRKHFKFKSSKLNKQSEADFYYIKPGTYYMRLFIDKNNNGVWDTGEYASRTQAETVFYYPKSLELKARWEIEQSWNPLDTPLTEQKPLEITKQKPDREKSIKNRNAERKFNKK